VLERREDLALLEEPADRAFVSGPPAPQELEGYGLLVLLIGALGEVDRAHAAVPDLSEEAVGTKLRRDRGRDFGRELAEQRGGELHRVTFEDAGALAVRQQRRSGLADRRIPARGMLQIRGTLVGC